MKEVIQFLSENPIQYMSTVGLDGRPKVRPFQYMLERDGKLWFCTSNRKEVFRELAANPWAELCVSAPDFSWLRLRGRAVFQNDRAVKRAVIDGSPLVKGLYGEADNPVFEVFYLAESEAVLADFSGNPSREYRL